MNYALRFPIKLRNKSKLITNWKTNFLFPTQTNNIPRGYNSYTGDLPNYYFEGFLSLQKYIAKIFLKMTMNTPDEPKTFNIKMQKFPDSTFISNISLEKFGIIISIVIMKCFLCPCINIVQFIVAENEKQLKEIMKIIGLPLWMHWICWFVKGMIYMIIVISIIVSILTVINIVSFFLLLLLTITIYTFFQFVVYEVFR